MHNKPHRVSTWIQLYVTVTFVQPWQKFFSLSIFHFVFRLNERPAITVILTSFPGWCVSHTHASLFALFSLESSFLEGFVSARFLLHISDHVLLPFRFQTHAVADSQHYDRSQTDPYIRFRRFGKLAGLQSSVQSRLRRREECTQSCTFSMGLCCSRFKASFLGHGCFLPRIC